MSERRRLIILVIVLVALYILMGNARSIKPNPFIPGAVLALNMIVVVFAGAIGGKYVGFFTGFLGTTINTFSPVGSAFEFAAIIPHTIMGYAAGSMKDHWPVTVIACTLLLGHILNIFAFSLVGLLDFAALVSSALWIGIIYETFIGIVSIIVLNFVYRIGFEDIYGTHIKS